MQNIIQHIKSSLMECYPESEIKAITKILISDILHVSMLDIYMGKDIKLSDKQLEELNSILGRLKKQEPLQYILGHTEFYGMDICVTENVLIPRPETTELVELIIRENGNKPLKALDVGTGSGCIAIALALNLPEAEVCAWDISPKALDVAKGNAERLGAKVCFEQVDVLNYYSENRCFDVIVSNPPYITEDEKKEMEANVLNWEPGLALFVPDENPLLFYRKIAELGLHMLSPAGKVYFEINRMFGKETGKMMEVLGYRNVDVFKDLSGNDRMLRAVL